MRFPVSAENALMSLSIEKTEDGSAYQGAEARLLAHNVRIAAFRGRIPYIPLRKELEVNASSSFPGLVK